MSDRIIGEVTSATGYPGLIATLRARVNDLGTTFECLDDVAGLPARYTAKLLAQRPIKSLGRSSSGAILGALGLKLIVAVDETGDGKRGVSPTSASNTMITSTPETTRLLTPRASHAPCG
jgi:hypothetical protein